MIKQCNSADFEQIFFIINSSARSYKGVIPDDCYHQPYMSLDELSNEMQRMTFFGWEDQNQLVGVMALEMVKDVSLIRHAYVLPGHQCRGIGGNLLRHIISYTTTPVILVGTWSDATWAISFYRKHGFILMEGKDKLLKTYWKIPQRQIETSVVLGIDQKKEFYA